MVDQFLEILTDAAEVLPLPIFIFIGAFVEEIIAPIPSPFVMTLAGSLSQAQNQPMIFLLLLAAVGAAGKTIGALIIYAISDKFEDIITTRFGKFIGVSHKQINSIHEKLERGKGEWVALFLLRALPIIPTAPVSVAAGILELNKKTYLASTACGLFVRNVFYLYLGYTSTNALSKLNSNLDSIENIGYFLILVSVAGLVYVIYRNRRKHM